MATGAASSSGVLPAQLAVAQATAASPGSATALTGGSKGLPMSVLFEVIQQHPSLKTRIQEIVSRKDYSEAQKMAAIQQIVRDAGGN